MRQDAARGLGNTFAQLRTSHQFLSAWCVGGPPHTGTWPSGPRLSVFSLDRNACEATSTWMFLVAAELSEEEPSGIHSCAGWSTCWATEHAKASPASVAVGESNVVGGVVASSLMTLRVIHEVVVRGLLSEAYSHMLSSDMVVVLSHEVRCEYSRACQPAVPMGSRVHIHHDPYGSPCDAWLCWSPGPWRSSRSSGYAS